MEEQDVRSVDKSELESEPEQRISWEKQNPQEDNRCREKLDFQKIKVVIVPTSNRNPHNPFSHMSAEESLQGIVDTCARIWVRAIPNSDKNSP